MDQVNNTINPDKDLEVNKIDSDTDSSICVDNDELFSTKQKLEEYIDLLKRTQADFINYKARALKDTQDLVFLKTKSIALEFIAIKDLLIIAKENEVNEDTKKALSVLLEKINNSLDRLNIIKIKLKDGLCDYNLCECISVVNTKNKEEDNKVLQVIEDGYTMNNKLIKPTKVIISKLEE